MALDILVVDDENDICELVAGVLEDEGYDARTAANSDQAIQALDERRPSLVLLDVWLQGSKLDGLDLLDEIKRRDPSLPVLMISGHGNIDTAVAASACRSGRRAQRQQQRHQHRARDLEARRGDGEPRADHRAGGGR